MVSIRILALLGVSACVSCTDSTNDSATQPEPPDKTHVWSAQTDALDRAEEAEKLIQDAAKSRAEQLDPPPK